MPGIILNRLSRAREGETADEVLQKGRAVLLQEMLPVIHPDAKEGADYLFLEDIISRLSSHKEGEILDRAMKHIESGRCAWLAVTEIPRLTGDGQTLFQVANLCRDHRVPIYTRERIYSPYQPWRAESYRELVLAFMLSVMEMSTYLARYERAREVAYPINSTTGKNRLTTMEGLGRHLNGKTPLGYRTDPQTRMPIPDTSIPCPDYIAPGTDQPAAFTLWEIVRYARQLGLVYGSNEVIQMIARETGFLFASEHLLRVWRNPFYAGRPTSTTQYIGGKNRRRAEPVHSVGKYEAMFTWEEHTLLLEAISRRRHTGEKHKAGNWATGLLRCECGQPFISHGSSYICRGRKTEMLLSSEQHRLDKGLAPLERHKPVAGYVATPTCGMILKTRVHAEVTQMLGKVFARPRLAEDLAEWEEAQRSNRVDRQLLYRQRDQIHADLRTAEEKRKRLIDLAVDGTITKTDLTERQGRFDKETEALRLRLARLEEAIAAPAVPPAAIDAIRTVLTLEFADFWNDDDILSDHQRGLIARGLIDHIPVRGTVKRKSRTLGTPCLALWLS